ncbi:MULTISPECIES: universal stress protein [Dyella]|uniref:Universal stress protein n=2 Tax=Dyella TaxID=231454 RepID=A0A4R0YK75_9GAMM|nr:MULTISPECIES: universal stress protein [Dyella]TBR37102.1 universal stress protein [Dyella terrae]TCI07808.1 universal stress protein [Dyella soli]
MFRHILIPTDGSELSMRGVRMGIDLAKTDGARVTAIHVVPPFHSVTYMAEMLAASEANYVLESAERAKKYLEDVKKLATEAGVACQTLTVESDRPDEVITQAAQDQGCDVIVIASHGWRGLTKLLLGSVTQKVLLSSPVPVLVCR